MKNDFNTHPWVDTVSKKPMNSLQISDEKNKLQNMSTSLKPELYAAKTNARLQQDYCNNLYNQDIESRWYTLDSVIPNWSYMSPEMQAATMDVHFTGNMEPKNSWTLAKGAAKRLDNRDYCDNLHRDDKDRDDIKERNKWVSDMCAKGRFYK
jgi:hypothetical protein